MNKGTFYLYKEGSATTTSHLHWKDLQRIYLKKLYLQNLIWTEVTLAISYFPFTATSGEIGYIGFDR